MTDVSDALFPVLFLKTYLCTATAPCCRWVSSTKEELAPTERSFHNTVNLFPALQQGERSHLRLDPTCQAVKGTGRAGSCELKSLQACSKRS